MSSDGQPGLLEEDPPAGAISPSWRTAARGCRAARGRRCSPGRGPRTSAGRRRVPCRSWERSARPHWARPVAPGPCSGTRCSGVGLANRPDESMTPASASAATASTRPEPHSPVGSVRSPMTVSLSSPSPVTATASIGAVGGAHAAADGRALEGWAGRRGGGEQPVAAAEHDLAVRADVDEQPDPRVAVHAAGQQPGGDVAAHVGAERGEDDRAGLRVGGNAQVAGADLGQQPGGQDERRDAERLRVDAEDQVDHGGVAGQGDLVDLVWRARLRPWQAAWLSSASVSWASWRSLSRAAGSSMVAEILAITSAPNGCCLLSIDSTATGVPVVRSSRVATTVVVPRSKARPNARPVVSPGSTAISVSSATTAVTLKSDARSVLPRVRSTARSAPVPRSVSSPSTRSRSVTWSASDGSASSR